MPTCSTAGESPANARGEIFLMILKISQSLRSFKMASFFHKWVLGYIINKRG